MSDNFNYLRVGEQFPHGAPLIPLLVSLSQAPLMCAITLNNITPDDEKLFAVCKAEFAFCQIEQGIISFMFKVRGLVSWCDCQYTPRADLFESDGQGIDSSIGMHTPVVLVLIEGTTGIIKGLRVVTVSYPFVYRLNKALEDINSVEMSTEVYQQRAKSIMKKYTAKQLVHRSKHIEVGGKTVN